MPPYIAPGIESTPLRRAAPHAVRGGVLVWCGQEYRLPDSCEVKISTRASTAWIRRGDLVVVLGPDGPVSINAQESRALASPEMWALL